VVLVFFSVSLTSFDVHLLSSCPLLTLRFDIPIGQSRDCFASCFCHPSIWDVFDLAQNFGVFSV